MVVSEVSLGRREELVFVVACELRPTLAVGDSLGPSTDCGHVAVTVATGPQHL
jgi:hypothetical protein